ncbi:hypothetical protein SAMN05216312_101420 [Cohnella sp. OV330]|nr:hypothetical protein SAMN05216312_101420 [Cohnella sp. OV330]
MRRAAAAHALSFSAAGRLYRLWTQDPLFPVIGSVLLDFGLRIHYS